MANPAVCRYDNVCPSRLAGEDWPFIVKHMEARDSSVAYPCSWYSFVKSPTLLSAPARAGGKPCLSNPALGKIKMRCCPVQEDSFEPAPEAVERPRQKMRYKASHFGVVIWTQMYSTIVIVGLSLLSLLCRHWCFTTIVSFVLLSLLPLDTCCCHVAAVFFIVAVVVIVAAVVVTYYLLMLLLLWVTDRTPGPTLLTNIHSRQP